MILETAQMLSTAHHELDGENAVEGIYKSTHKNHPSNIWVRENYGNYQYTWELLYHLLEQYKIRYKKTHATHRLLDPLSIRPKNISGMPVPTEPPQCMPDEYKVEGDSIQAYRNYYMGEKSYFAKWNYTTPPNWWQPKEIVNGR
tara:strand:- start:12624 stop:13055 length:432 start_codon:yes stop_codon:yes gene_type:complete